MEIWSLNSKLLLAIQDNDLQVAKEILSHDSMDPDVRFAMGYGNQIPAICLCVERGLYQMAKLLIDSGSSVNSSDDLGYTPLHFAASHQFTDLVKLLLANRADPNAASNYLHTPLHLACQQSSIEIVESLLEAGAKTDKKDSDGRTPLCMACICHQTSIVELMIKAGADVNTSDEYGNSPLIQAINSGLSIHYDLIKTVLNGGADPNHHNNHGLSPLITTIRRSSEHSLDGLLAVNELIDSGADLNDSEPYGSLYGQSAVHLSISRGQDRITEALIRSGADINIRNHRGFSPLHRVACEEKTDLVKLLLAAGANRSSIPKSFWTDDGGIERKFKDPKIRTLLGSNEKEFFFPSLKHLSRISFRRWFERKADHVARSLPNIPESLRQYILLSEL